MSLHDEGHTVAGWTGSVIGTVGSVAAGMGVCGWGPGIPLGLAISVVALLVTWGLHLAGWGKPPGPRPRDQWPFLRRDRSARGGHPDCLGCHLAGRRGVPARTPAIPEPTVAATATTATASASASAESSS
ncbi:HGxxPAAW family protein [Streptomyces tailanensis]|uniref:HGxxPAAW family protein n=1 Tax=Streptomyces tailanensis TaxID=2569858 RepID=UPI00122DF72A|nr:HGxxPAAW family protein [Streptomyces tailanensis]